MSVALNFLNLNFNSFSNKLSFQGRQQKPCEDDSFIDDDFYRLENTNYHSIHNFQKIRTKKKRNISYSIKKHGAHFYYKGCKRKVRYESKADANRSAVRLQQVYPHKVYGTYECEFCQGWHLYTKKSTPKAEIEFDSILNIIG